MSLPVSLLLVLVVALALVEPARLRGRPADRVARRQAPSRSGRMSPVTYPTL
ncbi:hypothetical protein ACFYM7_37070 [Streptomyces cyaneofuscatus]|uniref:hypothetical protein n=1 Tax=Streptomyces cyaneofuscatus TaxID=66883 RepID=UPI003682F3E9